MKKILSFLAIAAMLCCVACKKNPTPTPKPNGGGNEQQGGNEQEPETPKIPTITIDGDFADWATLPADKVKIAKCAEGAKSDAVKEIRCYATEMFVFYYIEYNSAQIGEILAGTTDPSDPEHNELPIRLNINTDGEWTSGYANYSLDAYDFIIEGALAVDGAWTSFDGNLYQRVNGSWTDPPLLEYGNGICSGAGKDNKYEIALVRELFNSAAMGSEVPMPMGDEFETGIRFYTASWGELSNMPNEAVTDDNSNGWGHLLRMTTNK